MFQILQEGNRRMASFNGKMPVSLSDNTSFDAVNLTEIKDNAVWINVNYIKIIINAIASAVVENKRFLLRNGSSLCPLLIMMKNESGCWI